MKTGSITIATHPPEARIYIDDILVLDENGEPGLTPAKLTITTGYHDIKLELDGYCDEFGGEYVLEDQNINVFRNFNTCQ